MKKKKKRRLNGLLVMANIAVVVAALSLHYGGLTLRASVAPGKENAKTEERETKKPQKKNQVLNPSCAEGTVWCETTKACVDGEFWESFCPGAKCDDTRACPSGSQCTMQKPFRNSSGISVGVCVGK